MAFTESGTKIVRVLSHADNGWQNVGNTTAQGATAQNTSSRVWYGVSLAFNNNVPYVAFVDVSNTVRVLQLQGGSSWLDVGAINAQGTSYVSLAFSYGVPSVAFIDFNDIVRILTYSSGSWIDVGFSTAQDSCGRHDLVNLAFNGPTPYVSFRKLSSTQSANAQVIAYSNSIWGDVGTLSQQALSEVRLVLNGDVPIIAFMEATQRVVKVLILANTGEWKDIGDTSALLGTLPGSECMESCHSVSLAVYNGLPYVAFQGVGGVYRVMFFDGERWADVDTIVAQSSGGMNLAIENGAAYVAYVESASQMVQVKQNYLLSPPPPIQVSVLLPPIRSAIDMYQPPIPSKSINQFPNGTKLPPSPPPSMPVSSSSSSSSSVPIGAIVGGIAGAVSACSCMLTNIYLFKV